MIKRTVQRKPIEEVKINHQVERNQAVVMFLVQSETEKKPYWVLAPKDDLYDWLAEFKGVEARSQAGDYAKKKKLQLNRVLEGVHQRKYADGTVKALYSINQFYPEGL